MAAYQCQLCAFVYDEESAGRTWDALEEDWACPICGSPKASFVRVGGGVAEAAPVLTGMPDEDYLAEWRRMSDEKESHMADIHHMAMTGQSIFEPMRTSIKTLGWDEILIRGAQLATIPLNEDEPVITTTVIGPEAAHPLVIETPLYVSHMSFGALSREAKAALAKGTAEVKTAMCSGEGGILKESIDNAYKYIFEYVPNRYSVTPEYLQRVDAIEIKIGQSAKPGMGGHLPGSKVTKEIAEIRGKPVGKDIVSPAHFDDITDADSLREKVEWLRAQSGGKPIGVKIAAGHIEADLGVALDAGPDFVTVDGRAGATGAALKQVKGSASVPTLFALYRARKFLDERGASNVSLVITGGLRVSADFAKALAMGADAVALATAAMMALGCQQYRICGTGKCPVGIATQDPELRKRLDVDTSAHRIANYLRVSTAELKDFARMTGNSDVHKLSVRDLCTANSEISNHTNIEHV
jgi:glutamate synthase domain-containing protein 2/rubredoxin